MRYSRELIYYLEELYVVFVHVISTRWLHYLKHCRFFPLFVLEQHAVLRNMQLYPFICSLHVCSNILGTTTETLNKLTLCFFAHMVKYNQYTTHQAAYMKGFKINGEEKLDYVTCFGIPCSIMYNTIVFTHLQPNVCCNIGQNNRNIE